MSKTVGPKVNIQHSHELHAISMPVMRREISHRKNINFKRIQWWVLPRLEACDAVLVGSTLHPVALDLIATSVISKVDFQWFRHTSHTNLCNPITESECVHLLILRVVGLPRSMPLWPGGQNK